MSTSEMAVQAARLREAFFTANPDEGLPTGATDVELEGLTDGFPGLVVPSELLELLGALNGSERTWLLLGQIGPLLAADTIATRPRRH